MKKLEVNKSYITSDIKTMIKEKHTVTGTKKCAIVKHATSFTLF